MDTLAKSVVLFFCFLFAAVPAGIYLWIGAVSDNSILLALAIYCLPTLIGVFLLIGFFISLNERETGKNRIFSP